MLVTFNQEANVPQLALSPAQMENAQIGKRVLATEALLETPETNTTAYQAVKNRALMGDVLLRNAAPATQDFRWIG